jgi:geranylgeranyl transferase type-2 subunit beta
MIESSIIEPRLAFPTHIAFLDRFYQAMPLAQQIFDAPAAEDLQILDTMDPRMLRTTAEIIHSTHLQMSAIYWASTAYFLLLGRAKDTSLEGFRRLLPMREQVDTFLQSCFTSVGGFSCTPGDQAHLLSTYSAIQIYALYGLDLEDKRSDIVAYIKSLQDPVTGSFKGDKWGEVDTRFSYCAIASLFILGGIKLIRGSIDLDNAVNFIQNCCNLDGGYGAHMGRETHSGQVFCSLATLSIVNRLNDTVHMPELGIWMAQRQCAPDGGLNGRPEKLQDVCYSWWILSSLSMIDCIPWIDENKLIDFIFSCQDHENGGFSDRPGNMTDLFHTLFALTGLSLLKYKNSASNDLALLEIDPVFCMPKIIIEDVILKHQNQVQ